MTRNEQQMYKDISELTKALTKLVKVIKLFDLSAITSAKYLNLS